MVRVAALQFGSGPDVERNLETCLRMIDRAARDDRAGLLVLPEFCNHISWYDDQAHAQRVALRLGDDFLTAIAERAREHGAHVVINVSLWNEGDRLTISSLLYGPEGELEGRADKQTLMGHENQFFSPAQAVSELVDSPFGRLGLYACRDGVTMETPRGLALRGAQMCCNSLNSFAFDEASLHIPARAAENGVFVVAANKVGPLVPEDQIPAISAATHIPERFLFGAGESQVVAPDGRTLAVAPRAGEAVVVAEVDLGELERDPPPGGARLRPYRRPQLYGVLGQRARAIDAGPASAAIEVAAFCPRSSAEEAIDEVVSAVGEAAARGVELLVLPELVLWDEPESLDPITAYGLFEPAVRAIATACRGSALQVVTSLVEEVLAPRSGRRRRGQRDVWVYQNMGVLIGHAGLIARQPQLHESVDRSWASPGNRLQLISLPWGNLALLVGEDALHPELARMATMGGAHLLAVPGSIREDWETRLGLASRAAENRVCVAACSRPAAGASLEDCAAGAFYDLEREFTIMTQWEERAFDGNISFPSRVPVPTAGTLVHATLHPEHANNKLMSQDTDLLAQRPWKLVSALLDRDLVPAASVAEHLDEEVLEDEFSEEDEGEQVGSEGDGVSGADASGDETDEESGRQPADGV